MYDVFFTVLGGVLVYELLPLVLLREVLLELDLGVEVDLFGGVAFGFVDLPQELDLLLRELLLRELLLLFENASGTINIVVNARAIIHVINLFIIVLLHLCLFVNTILT